MTPNAQEYTLERRHDLDQLRLWLTVLVICTWHVLDLTATGGVINQVDGPSFMRPSILLGIVRELPRAFVIPTCFWISGRLTARSVEGAAKSPGKLVADRTLRLLVPSVLFTLFLWPLALLPGVHFSDPTSLRRFLVDYWINLNGIKGPAWYSATLLCFDYSLALLKKATTTSAYPRQVLGSGRSTLVSARAFTALSTYGWVGVAVASYLIRQFFPNRVIFVPLSVRPGFVLGYVYSYAMGYQSFCHNMPTMAGLFAPAKLSDKASASPADTLEDSNNVHKWQEGSVARVKVSRRRARLRLIAAIVVSLGLYLIILIVPASFEISRRHLPDDHSSVDPGWTSVSETLFLRIEHLYFDAGLDMDTALYATWRELTIFGLIGPAITGWFHEIYSDTPQEIEENVCWLSRTWSIVFRPRYSFAAYLDHGPIGILLCWLVEVIFVYNSSHPWLHLLHDSSFAREVAQVVMTLVDFVLVTAVSFTVGWLVVEKVPGCKRIL